MSLKIAAGALITLSTFCYAELFTPIAVSVSNSNADIIETAKNMKAGFFGAELSNRCRESLEANDLVADRGSIVTCMSIYKRYNIDPYPFIKRFVDNVMLPVEKNSFELTSAQEQKLTCDDMLVALNKDTFENFFPKYNGEKLEKYAMDYCTQYYGENYLY